MRRKTRGAKARDSEDEPISTLMRRQSGRADSSDEEGAISQAIRLRGACDHLMHSMRA